MGSYATLTIDDVSIASYKNFIPLEAMLLFSTSDFEEQCRDTGQDAEDDDYPWPIRRFVTTAERAVERLDAIGIDLHTCHRWFEQFKEDEFSYFDVSSDDWETNSRAVPMTLELFEQHLHSVDIIGMLERIHTDIGPFCSLKDVEKQRLGIKDHDLDYFFTTESIMYYNDAIECLNRSSP